MRLAGETARRGDLDERCACLLEHGLRALNAAVEQVLVRRSSRRRPKRLQKMPSTVADLYGEILESQVSMQILLDEFEKSLLRSHVQRGSIERQRSSMMAGKRDRTRQKRKREAIGVEPAGWFAQSQFPVQQVQ